MLAKMITVAVVTLGALTSAAIPAVANPSKGPNCIIQGCPASRFTIAVSARQVHGPHGYKARGWACAHMVGRTWVCAEPRHRQA